MRQLTLIALTLLILTAAPVLAHDGRRFEIKVINDQLFAQGYISGPSPMNDGGGIVRPYLNAIHSHWSGSPSSTDLPGYDIEDQDDVVGYKINYTVTGGSRWNTTINLSPVLDPLAATELLQVVKGVGVFTNTDLLGTIELFSSVPHHGHVDLTFSYKAGSPTKLPALAPTNYLYVLEGFLSTDAPGIAPSGTVYTIFAPMGHEYHHRALALEEFLGYTIPEPASLTVLALGATALTLRRRRAA